MMLPFCRLLMHLYPRIIYAPDTGRSTNYTELSREFTWTKTGIGLYARMAVAQELKEKAVIDSISQEL